jgi:hypothetical protein
VLQFSYPNIDNQNNGFCASVCFRDLGRQRSKSIRVSEFRGAERRF